MKFECDENVCFLFALMYLRLLQLFKILPKTKMGEFMKSFDIFMLIKSDKIRCFSDSNKGS